MKIALCLLFLLLAVSIAIRLYEDRKDGREREDLHRMLGKRRRRP